MKTHSTSVQPDRMTRFVIHCSAASAAFAAAGILFLVIFYAGIPLFGPLNDAAVVCQYLLMLPVFYLVNHITGGKGGKDIQLVQVLGLSGMLAVITVQLLLILGVLRFERQIVMVIPAFLVVAAWFVATERAGRKDPRLPKGTTRAMLAGLVIGYPLWALDLRRRLVAHGSPLSMKKELE